MSRKPNTQKKAEESFLGFRLWTENGFRWHAEKGTFKGSYDGRKSAVAAIVNAVKK